MNLETDAYLYRQSKAIRACIIELCDRAGLKLEDLQAPKTERAMAARNCLICQLANMGLPSNQIDEIIKAKPFESYNVIKRQKTDYSMKTASFA